MSSFPYLTVLTGAPLVGALVSALCSSVTRVSVTRTKLVETSYPRKPEELRGQGELVADCQPATRALAGR